MIKTFFAKARKQLQSVWPKKAQPEAAPVSEPAQQEQPQPKPEEQRRPARRRRPERPKAPPQPEWTLAEFPVAPAEGRCRFHDFGLPLELMRGIDTGPTLGFLNFRKRLKKECPNVRLGYFNPRLDARES